MPPSANFGVDPCADVDEAGAGADSRARNHSRMPSSAPSAVTRSALVILAVIACGVVLYVLRDIFTPLALAIFLAVMIDGLARLLLRRAPFLPRAAAAPAAIVLSIAVFAGAAVLIAENAADFVVQIAAYGPRLNGLMEQAAGLLGVQAPQSLEQLIRQLNPAQYLSQVGGALQGFASSAVFVLIYLGFILASRRGFERKIVGLFPDRHERREAVAAFHRIRDGVEQYLWVQTVTGVMIAVASWIAMALVGLDNALFWALLIFIASYIPIIGGIVGVAAPPIFALLQFDSLWPAAILAAVLQGVQFVVGNIIQPRMQGESLNMDPVVILLSLALWGAIWGLPGMFLSTPIAVMAMVILAQFDGTRWIAILLSDDGEPVRAKDADFPTAAPPPEAAPQDFESGASL